MGVVGKIRFGEFLLSILFYFPIVYGTDGIEYNVSLKFSDIWDDIEEAFEEKCLEKFQFGESLNGKCSDTYRKLIEFRTHCWELFEYTFGGNSTWKSKDPSKSIGQSASEFCDSFDEDGNVATESSLSIELTFESMFKSKLICLYKNYHYLDAYGRVDESELQRSYDEALIDVDESNSFIKICSRRANSKYRTDYLGDMVFELQSCMKQHSPEFATVVQLRNEHSKDY
uniref:Putative secreted protein n=2 Tax=Haematobia irritans TaxID=7368 RepID=A0A1L8E6B0_HAEIR